VHRENLVRASALTGEDTLTVPELTASNRLDSGDAAGDDDPAPGLSLDSTLGGSKSMESHGTAIFLRTGSITMRLSVSRQSIFDKRTQMEARIGLFISRFGIGHQGRAQRGTRSL
jgi:hypothetical protein